MSIEGKNIVITRAKEQALSLAEKLGEKGANPISYPCIKTVAAFDQTTIKQSMLRLADGQFDWFFFTSQNAVKFFKMAAAKYLPNYNMPLATRVAAVGPKTAELVEKTFLVPISLVPKTFDSESLINVFAADRKQNILLPQGNLADNTLKIALNARGHKVHKMVIYHTVPHLNNIGPGALLKNYNIHAITFASPSAVSNFCQSLRNEEGYLHLLKNVVIAVLGPKTRTAALSLGLEVHIMAKINSVNGLVTSIEEFFDANLSNLSLGPSEKT